MNTPSPLICLVDDDAAVRSSILLLMRDSGFDLAMFPGGREFLEHEGAGDFDCLLLNLRMPEMSGLEVLDRMRSLGSSVPVIFVTGYASVELAVQMIRSGAFDVLEKPFCEERLLDLVRRAVEVSSQLRQIRKEKIIIQDRFDRLTRREREVLALMVEGDRNSEIARKLEISPKTLDIHRTKVLEKLEARTIADAVRWRIFAQTPEADWPGSVGHL